MELVDTYLVKTPLQSPIAIMPGNFDPRACAVSAVDFDQQLVNAVRSRQSQEIVITEPAAA